MNADLITLLNAAAPVAAIATGGITWQFAAQAPGATDPFSVLTRTSGAIGMTHEGLSGLNQARVQVDCYAPTFAQADALRTAIHEAACGKPGIIGATDFQAITANAPRDFQPVGGLHRCLADITVQYKAAPIS